MSPHFQFYMAYEIENRFEVQAVLREKHNTSNAYDLCSFGFWYEYYTDAEPFEDYDYFRNAAYTWPSTSTFQGHKLPGYPFIIYDDFLDLSINGVVNLADAGLHSLRRKGSFDFHSEEVVRKV